MYNSSAAQSDFLFTQLKATFLNIIYSWFLLFIIFAMFVIKFVILWYFYGGKIFKQKYILNDQINANYWLILLVHTCKEKKIEIVNKFLMQNFYQNIFANLHDLFFQVNSWIKDHNKNIKDPKKMVIKQLQIFSFISVEIALRKLTYAKISETSSQAILSVFFVSYYKYF